MAIDTSIYAQMGTRPKSYGDYRQEIDTQQNNALLNQMNALKLQQAQQGVADDQAMREAAKNFGADSTANYNALLQRGLPGQAQAYQKATVDADKDRAEIRSKNATTKKTEYDSARAQLTQGLQVLQSAKDPQSAAQMVSQGVQAGYWDMQQAQGMLKDMPQDPAGFGQWRDRQLLQGLDIAKRMELQRQTREDGRKNANELITQTPDGQFVPNRPLINAKTGIAQAGASNVTLGTPQPMLLPGSETPVMVQPGNRPGAQPQVMVDPATGKPLRPAKDPTADKPLNDSQAKALLFGSRMQEADKILDSLDGKYSPAAVNAKAAAERVPLVGGVAGMAGNAMIGDGGQQAEQAQRDFINAVLRRESGAAIAASEFDNARKQYFPQPNDSQAVLAQKRNNRQISIRGLLAEVPASQRASLTTPATAPSVPADIGDLLKKYGGK